ncbi:phage portal protein [Pandoraea sp. CB10b_02]|uniref:phage portal protein n=1 Tax=Pandoraea sp. CB10b_02 TaxID=2014535 RepID=UPI00257D151A|nr:phage portal protein [Pandoraea sp. CB10b_02]
MKLFGFDVSRANRKAQMPVDSRGGWLSIVREAFAGAWQRNIEYRREDIYGFYAVYRCITLISNDIGKLSWKLMRLGEEGIWTEDRNPAYSPLLKSPNNYQNHIQFKEWWVTSKLSRGNTYALKRRDNRGVVKGLYILDPMRVTPLVTEDGGVYYQLNTDDLNDLPESVTVPASEIIHDRMNCLFHPLVGISPLYASALSAANGIAMQKDSHHFFVNGARPGGILTAPGAISDATADRLKKYWDENFTNDNAGRVAVLGDGLKFEAMKATAVDSQLVEQLKLTGEVVCSAFGVPPFKIGIGTLPAGQKVEDLNQIYYTDCVQSHIEQMELCLTEGLGLSDRHSIEFDTDGLLRMDTETLYTVLGAGVKNSLLAPNEARRRVNLKPVTGGDSPLSQQQNYSLEALAKRDSLADPFGMTGKGQAQPQPAEPAPAEQPTTSKAANASTHWAMSEAIEVIRYVHEVAQTSFDAATRNFTEVAEELRAYIDQRLEALPVPAEPQKGEPGKDGRDGVDGKDGEPGKDGKDGRDGVDGKDGAPGKDGADGRDGVSPTPESVAQAMEGIFAKWAIGFERHASEVLERAIERMPKPKDGKDALQLETFDARLDEDGRTLVLSLSDGERIVERTVRLGVMLDKGVYKDGAVYEAGDAVTFGGCIWVARKDAPDGRPDISADWRLAVKKGRDGKDGRNGKDAVGPIKASRP